MNVGEDYISKFDKKYFSFVQPKNFDLYNNFLHMYYNYEFNNLQMDILRKFGDGEDIYIDNLPRCTGITTILELIALVEAESNCCYNIIFYTDDRAGLRHFMVNNSLLRGNNYKTKKFLNGSILTFAYDEIPFRGMKPDLIIIDDYKNSIKPEMLHYAIKNAELIVNSALAYRFKQIKDSLN